MSDQLPAVRDYTVPDLEIMAKQVAASRMFGMDAAQAFTLMLLCQAKGLNPIQAVERYHVINGRPAMKADAMLAEFQAKGGSVQWRTDTNEECDAVFTHPIHAPRGNASKFTIADAKRADLLKNPTWQKYPANMLRARVISNGIRKTMPGIVAGIYTPEEVQDFEPVQIPPHAREEARVATGGVQPSLRPPQEPEPASNLADAADAYLEASRSFVDARNAAWAQEWAPQPVHPLINPYQLTSHLLKWGLLNGLIPPFVDFDAETGKPLATVTSEQRLARVATLYREHAEAVSDECEQYARDLADAARRKWGREHDDDGERKGDVWSEAETEALSS